MNKSIKLSGRELDALKVLWESEKPLTAKEKYVWLLQAGGIKL